MIKYIYFIFILTTISFANDGCKYLLDFENSHEKRFAIYLNKLLDISVINLEDLLKIKEDFENNRPTYLIELLSNSTATGNFHKTRIELFTQKNDLDYRLVSKFINVSSTKVKEKNIIKNLGKLPFYPIKFVKIKSSNKTYKPLFSTHKSKIESISVDKDFEIMDTPITQYQWYKVTGTAPADMRYTTTDIIDIGKNSISPDHPVTNITYDNIVGHYTSKESLYRIPGGRSLFTKKVKTTLSKVNYEIIKREKKHSLKSFKYKEGFLDKINKLSRNDDQLIYELIPDHIQFSTYRLPYIIEWQLIIDMEGSRKGPISIQELAKHTRKIDDFAFRTADVMASPPLTFNNKKIYDAIGNGTYEFCNDYLFTRPTDEQVDLTKKSYILSEYRIYLENYYKLMHSANGLSHITPVKTYNMTHSEFIKMTRFESHNKTERIGFRLVREIND